jgi:hypothetical protein
MSLCRYCMYLQKAHVIRNYSSLLYRNLLQYVTVACKNKTTVIL